MRIGTIQSLWRYPVKSMLGEQLSSTSLGPLGIPGDRGYAIRDERAGEIRGAKNIPQLFQFSARYLAAPSDYTHSSCRDHPAEPNDRTDRRSNDTHTDSHKCWAKKSPSGHVNQKKTSTITFVLLVVSVTCDQSFGLEEGEPLPSFEGIPRRFSNMLRRWEPTFDAYPIHLLTTASLQGLSAHYPEGAFVPERFRPNIVIATDDNSTPDVEASWKGKVLRLGRLSCL